MESKSKAAKRHGRIPPADTPKNDVYTIVTDRIIAQLEKGTVPWRQPWTDAGIPRNLISKRPYRGINHILLAMLGYEHNLFLTYHQLQQLGGAVRPGERPHLAVFWNFPEAPRDSAAGDDAESAVATGKPKRTAYLRYYLVYNIAQCSGIPAARIPVVTKVNDPIPVCDGIVQHMPLRPLIKHSGHEGAFYAPAQDYVQLPNIDSFESAESYYAVLFHELIHATGHPSRLDRKNALQMQEHGALQVYSHEELVAEIGSCFLLSFAGIDTRFEQSADYIRGWLEKLQSDKRFIFSAGTAAQKATDFILNLPGDAQSVESNPKPDISVGLFYALWCRCERLRLLSLVSNLRPSQAWPLLATSTACHGSGRGGRLLVNQSSFYEQPFNRRQRPATQHLRSSNAVLCGAVSVTGSL